MDMEMIILLATVAVVAVVAVKVIWLLKVTRPPENDIEQDDA